MTEMAQLLAACLALSGQASGAARLVGIGWATVDGERTISDASAAARHGASDELLGARSWIVDVDPVRLVILEPSTEGRLAAALARRGEGIVALYLEVEGHDVATGRDTALGVPGRLLPHDRPWGPFLIVVGSTHPVSA